jgi:hypothetical protein
MLQRKLLGTPAIVGLLRAKQDKRVQEQSCKACQEEHKMQGILYEEPSIWQFFFVTCLLGGGAAWMTGRACAQTWRSYVSLVLYLLLLGISVRFIHHALFNGTMFSLQYYIVDTIALLIIGSLGFRYTRTNQMVTQYHWLYERASTLSWKPKG